MQLQARHTKFAVTGFLAGLRPHMPMTPRLQEVRRHLAQGHVYRAKAAIDALYPLAPQDPDVLHLQADCTLAVGQCKDAIAMYDRALAQSDTAGLWAGKGRALQSLCRLRQAAACFQRAWALDQTRSAYLSDAAHCLIKAGCAQEAFETLSPAPANGRTALLRAQAMYELGQAKQAFEHAIAALTLGAETGQALRLARTLAQHPGDVSKVRAAARNISAPRLASHHEDPDRLAASTPLQRPYLAQQDLANIHNRLSRTGAFQSSNAMLHHMLFRHYDYVDDRRTAWAHLQAFHALALKENSAQAQHHTQIFNTLKRLRFTPLPPSKSSLLPIFVCGLPGAGIDHASRLIQAGARPALARPLHLVSAVMDRFMRTVIQSNTRTLSRDDLMGLQSDLRSGLAQVACGSEIVIDTTPLNFRWSGLLCAALPEARIVHVKGDSMQTKWALYSRALDDEALPFRHQLNEITSYQNQSRRLMRYWEGRFARSIHTVSGKTLTQNARDMLDACQLKYSEHCPPAQPLHHPDWRRYASFLTLERHSP